MKSRLRRLREVSASPRRLLLHGVLVVAWTRLALALAGTASARRVAAEHRQARVLDVALQAMLARRGHPARVEIGVLKDPAFRAHAWVVAGDRVLLGGSDRHLYRPIAILE